MKNIFRLNSIFILLLMSALTFSCSSEDNEDLGFEEGEEFDAELIVSESGVGDKRIVTVTGGSLGEVIKTRIKFTSTTKSMKRLYITENTEGVGENPYVFTSQEVDAKPDGSLDLVGDDKKEFEFKIDLPAPTLTNGTIVYKLWATTGRGDFRDVTKRNVFEDNVVGTITVNYGTGTNAASGINSFTQTLLAAPLADGSSSTFISLFNNKVYKINQGEEYAALWDFGYYYGASGKASLASSYDYPAGIINIPSIANVTEDELNKTYFALSSFTPEDFDGVAEASGLNSIVSSGNQAVTNLSVGDVVEFVDAYGNKGLIKVTKISAGDGSSGSITLDIKVQN